MSKEPEFWVKPGEGRRVRLAGGGVVPATGMPVVKDHFISKLLFHGDLVEMDPPAADAAAKAPAANPSPAPAAAPTGGTEVSASKSTGS